MATGTEHEICVFGFSQVGWAVGQTLDMAASGPPNKCRSLVHQEFSKRFARPRKVQEVQRANVCSNLSSFSSKKKGRMKEVHVQGKARRGSVDISRLAFLVSDSWTSLGRLLDVSWLTMQRRRCPATASVLTGSCLPCFKLQEVALHCGCASLYPQLAMPCGLQGPGSRWAPKGLQPL